MFSFFWLFSFLSVIIDYVWLAPIEGKNAWKQIDREIKSEFKREMTTDSETLKTIIISLQTNWKLKIDDSICIW